MIYTQGERQPYCAFLMVPRFSDYRGHVAQEGRGCLTGELAECLDEMRLIDVAAVGRQVGPRNRTQTLSRLRGHDVRFADRLVGSRAVSLIERAHQAIEAQQPRDRLGCKSHARL